MHELEVGKSFGAWFVSSAMVDLVGDALQSALGESDLYSGFSPRDEL